MMWTGGQGGVTACEFTVGIEALQGSMSRGIAGCLCN